MLQLLIKDIRIQKKFILLGFVFIGVFFFILGAFEGMPLTVPAAILSHFLIVVASKSDEKNNNGRMLASFPLRRIDIVTAKYAGVVMFISLSFLLTLLWRGLAGLVLPVQEMPWFSLQSVILTLAVLLVFYAIYFPLFFATGPRLVQVLDLIVIMSVGGALVIAIRVMEWLDIPVGNFLHNWLTSDYLTGMFWLLGASLLLIILSWCVSLFVYTNRSV
ncbi:ABC-2 transporter permease [Paenibacillus sp. MMS20-IR301]|uniref:ABC-2 transporter permease n=1 Tax=Paenibacillus sp. MMS20-IR301 TaxID=2895946 RepID=UPI0028E6AABA|nr:ABC-2 transporter permease [Paenibacillus sp. MMS20-IR301]WNS44700.1 ABC-2 transporter permease [Paenibacillus sp. MMS20-IR301]